MQDARITFTPETSGTYYLAASSERPNDVGTYTFSATQLSTSAPADLLGEFLARAMQNSGACSFGTRPAIMERKHYRRPAVR